MSNTDDGRSYSPDDGGYIYVDGGGEEDYVLTKEEIHDALSKISEHIRNTDGPHNCYLAKHIENEVVLQHDDSVKDGLGAVTRIPDEVCPICLENLSAKLPGNICCGNYPSQLRCGHWVHMYCHTDSNPNLYQCPVCRSILCNPIKLMRDVIEITNSVLLPEPYLTEYRKKGWSKIISDNEFISRIKRQLPTEIHQGFLEGLSLCQEFDSLIGRMDMTTLQ